MRSSSAGRWACRMAALFLLIVSPQVFSADLGTARPQDAGPVQQDGQQAQAAREAAQPLNNAPFWRDVREGETNAYQTSQVRGVDTTILVQSAGEIWRQLRNGPITVFGGWLLAAAFLAVAGFYWWRGKIMLKEPRTGFMITRFTAWERVVHWSTAGAFVILAVSGIFMLFGRYVILPLLGSTAFSFITTVGKNLHNFVGPLFVVCTLLMFVTFVRDNLFRRYDWTWLRRVGDFLRGRHVSSGKYNAGEKAWFWFGVTLLGIAVSVTGLVLDFSNFGQGRQTMQLASVVHAAAAIGFMALSIGHIYLGTIGLEGSYDAMRHGTVDETWAREHHDIWYHQVMAARARPSLADGGNQIAGVQRHQHRSGAPRTAERV